MADTIPDIKVSGAEWIDLYAVTGITVGNDLSIMNKSSRDVLIQETASQPLASSDDGRILSRYNTMIHEIHMYNSPSGAWAKCSQDAYEALINVQEG